MEYSRQSVSYTHLDVYKRQQRSGPIVVKRYAIVTVSVTGSSGTIITNKRGYGGWDIKRNLN